MLAPLAIGRNGRPPAEPSQPGAFYEFLPASGELQWSPGAAATLGVGDELPASFDDWRNLTHPDDRARVGPAFRALLILDAPVAVEYRLRVDAADVAVREEAARLPSGRVVGHVRAATADALGAFTETVPVGTLLVDADGNITHANRAALHLFGYEAGDLCGRPTGLVLPDSDTGKSLAGREVTARRRDGSEMPVAVSTSLVRDGENFQAVLNIVDLSASKRAESDLRRFFHIAADLLCVAGMDGRFHRVNPSFTRALDFTADELKKRTLFDLAHPEDRDAARLEVRKLAAGANPARFRCRLRDRNGRYRWLDWHATPTPEGTEFFAAARDITDQVAMERLLLNQEQRERALLDNTSAVIYLKRPDGRYEFVNRTYLTMFNLTWEEVVGKTDHEIHPAPFAEAFVRNDAEVLKSGEQITVEESAQSADGGVRTFVSVKMRLEDPSGGVLLAGISTDITDRLRASQAEEELKLARIVQQRLYPTRFPDIPGLDIAGASLPMAQLCGDYYDYVHDEEGRRLWLAVGDVSGHGLGPGLTMVEIRSLLRVLLPQSDLKATFARVNHALLADSPESFFVTLFVVEIDLDTGDAKYVGAGHDAWILRADGSCERVDSTGPPLGVVETDYEVAELPGGCRVGDVLLLYTDGVPEASSPGDVLFGRDRMVGTVEGLRFASAADAVRGLFAETQAFAEGHLNDDITAIVLKILPR